MALELCLRKIEANTGGHLKSLIGTFLGLALLTTFSFDSAACDETYIPEHTPELLWELRQWGIGGAFNNFAKEANVEFDRIRYNQDCPNREVFNFGLATGTSCLKMDVAAGFLSMDYVLTAHYYKSINNPESIEMSFQDFYLEKARQTGFDGYISVSNP